MGGCGCGSSCVLDCVCDCVFDCEYDCGWVVGVPFGDGVVCGLCGMVVIVSGVWVGMGCGRVWWGGRVCVVSGLGLGLVVKSGLGCGCGWGWD